MTDIRVGELRKNIFCDFYYLILRYPSLIDEDKAQYKCLLVHKRCIKIGYRNEDFLLRDTFLLA